jgi:putative membrane-bound dehydrogenase-like protein
MHRLLVALFLLVSSLPAAGQDTPLTPEQSAARIKLPEGFRVSLFAGEPDVLKPIAMTTDERGRLWVVESHSYPNWLTNGGPGRDRVLIFEDRAGKGHFDSCKVFLDNGTNLSGITVGFGGVWLCATPNLLFIPARPGEDRPAGPAQVVLDGWDLKARHNVFNTLVWGPDGWLYGCNGILSQSRIGRPGTPDRDRVAINCGVWRYHPTRKSVEAFAHGTTNPWGLDFDERGEMFITNCVIKHLFHVISGAHYVRMYGQDLNPYCYGLLESCADHIHWAGGNWTTSRGGQGAHGESGGGHAHAGALVYQGDNFPPQYRGRVFMGNLHGNRVNMDVLERRGSGYVAHHGQDFLMAHDSWFRCLVLTAAPDGGVYVADWHDTGECHNYDKTHPSGRIYKVTFGLPAARAVDLSKASDTELVKLQLGKDDWHVRQARRVLQERAASDKLTNKTRLLLKELLHSKVATHRLRGLWALHVTGGVEEAELLRLLESPDEVLRGWVVRLLLEDRRASEAVQARLVRLVQSEPSPWVRLALAAGLQRLPAEQRWTVAEGLLGHGEDAGDANLPLMLWYGVEALGPADPDRAAGLLGKAKVALVRQHLARRLTSLPDRAAARGQAALVRLLAAADSEVQRDVLRGMHEALQGQRQLPMPEGWAAVARKLEGSPTAEVREKVLFLSVLFGDAGALARLRKTIADPAVDEAARRSALQTLVEARAADLLPLLRGLVSDRVLRRQALQALATVRDPETPALILKLYPKLGDAEKADALATLSSRPEYALALLEAMERNQVPRRDLSAYAVRQLLALNDKKLTEKIHKVWGAIRPPSQEKKAQLARYLNVVPPDALKKADRSHGRALFVKNCATCHTLFGEGARIGPELTGSQRGNPEYLLNKLLDPSAVVAKDYQMVVLTTSDGRTLSGLVKEENDRALTLQTATQAIRLAKTDVEERRQSTQSLMPDNLLTPLKDEEVRDLIAYLAGDGQVPLPKQAEDRPGRP